MNTEVSTHRKPTSPYMGTAILYIRPRKLPRSASGVCHGDSRTRGLFVFEAKCPFVPVDCF